MFMRIFCTFLFVVINSYLFSQSNCSLFTDNIKLGDTLKISIKISSNRSEIVEYVLIYKNESEKLEAILNCDSITNNKVVLSSSKVNDIKLFEREVRVQKITSNIPLNIHSFVEYEIKNGQGSISYFTKYEFYSLYKELLK